MKIGELFVELGFHADQTKLTDFMHSIGELNMSSIMATMGLGGMYETIRKIMGVAEQTALGINTYGMETGMSTKQMQQWSAAAEAMGVKGDVVVNSLKSMQNHLTGLALGTDPTLLQPFAILNKFGAGLSGKESPSEVFEKISQVINKLPDGLRRIVTEEMGIDDSMLLILRDWNKFNELTKAEPFMTSEQRERLMEYHKEVSNLGHTWKTILGDIGSSIVPILEGWLKIAQGALDTLHANQWLVPVLTVVVGLIALAVGLLAPWSLAITAIVAGVGLLAKYWENINGWVENTYNKLKSMPILHQMDQLLNILGPSTWAHAPAIAGSSTSTITNHFNVFSNDPDEAARKVAETMRRIHSEVTGQSPHRER